MPKARAPLDYARYQALHAQKLSLRQIAKELGIPESTLRDNLKVMQKAQASYGLPQEDQGPPEGDKGLPKTSTSCLPRSTSARPGGNGRACWPCYTNTTPRWTCGHRRWTSRCS